MTSGLSCLGKCQGRTTFTQSGTGLQRRVRSRFSRDSPLSPAGHLNSSFANYNRRASGKVKRSGGDESGLEKIRSPSVEAAAGFEPAHKGFADLSLNHLGTPPSAAEKRAIGYASPGIIKAPLDTPEGPSPSKPLMPDPGITVQRWSGRRDSNSRPQPWQGCALPAELRPRKGTDQLTLFSDSRESMIFSRCSVFLLYSSSSFSRLSSS